MLAAIPNSAPRSAFSATAGLPVFVFVTFYVNFLAYLLAILQESRAIEGRTARYRCKFRYVSNFTISR